MADPSGDDTFASDWLSLREPADHRARSTDLAERLDRLGSARGWSRGLDLGTGRGSNLRWLSPRLGWVRRWTAVDHDAALLRELERTFVFEGEVRAVRGDLRREGLDEIDRADLVAASALLDLVSADWLEAFADRCAAAGCAVLVALTWDGSIAWETPDPTDGVVLEAVRRHQTGEKGMGVALGPAATVAAACALRNVGFEVQVEPSPWHLRGDEDRGLTEALLDGWVEAALEVRHDRRAEIEAWRERRLHAIRSGRYAVRVGHHDLLAVPPGSAP